MRQADTHTELYSRVFKGLMLSEDIARREEAGELLRPETSRPPTPLFGDFEAYFSRDIRERAEKMTYAYCLFYCFENEGGNWSRSVCQNAKVRIGGRMLCRRTCKSG